MRNSLCIECQTYKPRKNSPLCQSCKDEKMRKKILEEEFKDIRVDVPEHKYF